jgi:hypothetical protein
MGSWKQGYFLKFLVMLFKGANLPMSLTYKTSTDLIRVGSKYDGGYLVSQSDIDASDILIGLGINDDWRFEEHFKSLHDVEVFAYDGSVGKSYFFRKMVKAALRFYSPGRFLSALKTLIRYTQFFGRAGVSHIEKYVGFDSAGIPPWEERYVTLQSIFDSFPSENMFLKIDVEGAEYQFLDTLIKNQERLTGLVIEFHDCDLQLERIEKFKEAIHLKLVHIHANNNATIHKQTSLPTVLEFTFSRNSQNQEEPTFPHALDMPNRSNRPEIMLSFE